MSSVVTTRSSPRPSPSDSKACAPVPDRRSGIAVTSSAQIGCEPVAGHELDQVAPVRADVGEGPRPPRQRVVDPPVVVVLVRQPVLQVGAVDQPEGVRSAGDAGLAPRAPSGRSGRRTGRWPRPRRRPLPCAGVRPRRRRGPAASHRRRACRRRARPRRAGRGGGSACRCGRRRRRGTRRGPRRRRRTVSAPRRSAASLALAGVAAATPTSRAPARRAALAWTAPMKPAPTTPTRNADRPERPAGGPPTPHILANFCRKSIESCTSSFAEPADFCSLTV